ncbi:FecR family protein [Mucilaginibacter gracilis]|uniref:FecR family protein n=1 Tax=Mucilaginibacter gracilis TaxID=423350 RepID=A0A495IVI7_9SPHI|nr:FecR family protein [Mucilaginibacter gracilis]RKR80008.1 FecR family protein [Mucilaginibacter gracilis]
MKKERLQYLLDRYLDNDITNSEFEELDRWYHQLHIKGADLEAWAKEVGGREILLDGLYLDLLRQIEERQKVRRLKPVWKYLPRVAAAVLFFASGVYFASHKKPAAKSLAVIQHDVSPGHNRATLTLANGQKIILTKGLKGTLAQQGQTIITANNQDIAYHSNNKNEKISYNILTTARGEQSPYPLVLADGTKVWLDAASSITFPTAFNGVERRVRVTGEAYFEVKHNAAQPFRVQVKDQVIEDIGTTFNINAYDDEPVIQTTLVEGSVRTAGLVIKPGQSVRVSAGNAIVIKDDVEQVTAWRNGQFRFDDEPLESLMRRVARWYDVKIEYEQENYKTETYAGVTTRYANVSQLCSKLEKVGDLKFEIEGRTIRVTAK